MAKVFSPEEILHVKTPLRYEVGETASRFRAYVIELVGCGAIKGAMAFGSVPAGTYTPRSDIDWLVMYDHEQRESAIEQLANAAINAQPSETPGEVDIMPILFSDRDATKGNHTVDWLFAQHLLGGRGDSLDVIGQNPAEALHFKEVDPVRILDAYLRNKAQRIDQPTITRSLHDFRPLERALNTPASVARRYGTFIDLSQPGEYDVPLSVNKPAMQSWLAEVIPATREPLEALQRLDDFYDDLLQQTLEGSSMTAEVASNYNMHAYELKNKALPQASRLIRLVGQKALDW